MQCRNISLNNLLFIKEDVILPHSVTFHRLISRKVRSRTGPLFDFGVHEDVRACSDSRIKEKTDAHAGAATALVTLLVLAAGRWQLLVDMLL